MNALFIDSFTRNMEVSTVSVTEVPGKGLVLRFGAEVGPLWKLTDADGVFRNAGMPIIVAMRGYAAQSSEGFVGIVADPRGDRTRIHTNIVGIQGMPFQKKGKGLSVMASPMEVTVLRPGTNITLIETHARRKSGRVWHSNSSTAAAAVEGIRLRSIIRPNSIFVVEGQRDYAQAWELMAEHSAYAEKFSPEFPEEHRASIFSSEKMLESAVRRLAKGSESRMVLTYAVLCAAYRAGQTVAFVADFPETTRRLLGDEEIRRIAEEKSLAYEAAGWKVGFDMSLANHFTRVVGPNGVEATGMALFHAPSVERALSELSTLNSEEEKQKMLSSSDGAEESVEEPSYWHAA